MPPPRKQPQDRKAPAGPEGLTWTSESGAKIVLPPIGSVPAGVWRKVRHMDDMDGTFTLLEAVLDEDGLAVLDALPMDELNDLFEQWRATAGASPGESLNSST